MVCWDLVRSLPGNVSNCVLDGMLGSSIGLWSSTDGITWSSMGGNPPQPLCTHIGEGGAGDDRESMWVDNTSSSLHYGRIYVSWNDTGTSPPSLRASYSDDGVIWSSPYTLVTDPPSPSTDHIHDMQITGGQ